MTGVTLSEHLGHAVRVHALLARLRVWWRKRHPSKFAKWMSAQAMRLLVREWEQRQRVRGACDAYVGVLLHGLYGPTIVSVNDRFEPPVEFDPRFHVANGPAQAPLARSPHATLACEDEIEIVLDEETIILVNWRDDGVLVNWCDDGARAIGLAMLADDLLGWLFRFLDSRAALSLATASRGLSIAAPSALMALHRTAALPSAVSLHGWMSLIEALRRRVV